MKKKPSAPVLAGVAPSKPVLPPGTLTPPTPSHEIAAAVEEYVSILRELEDEISKLEARLRVTTAPVSASLDAHLMMPMGLQSRASLRRAVERLRALNAKK